MPETGAHLCQLTNGEPPSTFTLVDTGFWISGDNINGQLQLPLFLFAR